MATTITANVVDGNTVATSIATSSAISANVAVAAAAITATVITGGIGPQGPTGATGPQGSAGQGVPTGGTTGQVLSKNSNTDFDTEWSDPSGGTTGITRAIVVTSGSVTAGSTASTDYTYLVAGAHVITLPTATGNTNRYTVKNNHSADITINTTSSQTIDGTTSILISPEDSVDIISDNTNWRII